MANTHRTSQKWENWLSNSLGQHLLETEQRIIPSLYAECYGKYALLIGVPNQFPLIKFSSIKYQVILSPIINKNKKFHIVESDFYELPIASGSVDLVLLPHTLEFVDNPRKLLSEACRVVKPEGYIIIVGFNPYSLWGLKKKLLKNNQCPWSNNFISASSVKEWLLLADFELIKQDGLFFRPPLQHHDSLFEKLKFLEWIGSKLWSPLGGVYMLLAKAKVVPLTPIKLHWQQQLSGVQVSITGPSVRNWV